MLGGRRRTTAIALCIAITLIITTLLSQNWYQLRNALSYASRPLWDTPDGPRHIIPHYHAEGLAVDDKLCKLHGWTARPENALPEVWDAVLFSGELDLLEIRLHELNGVVDKFFILESNRTFTGLPKPLYFADVQHSPRFAPFHSKIAYQSLLGPSISPHSSPNPWKWESAQRDALSLLIRSHLVHLPSSAPAPLVLMSDVDELPAAHTLSLLRRCAFRAPLHLQLQEYLYSFEWPRGWRSWRAQVHEWGRDTYYRHSMVGDVALADAGWHCSFCFPSVADIAAKMQGYSHADRIGGDKSLLSPERIQKVICQGKDVFNMLPEAYSYKDLFQLMDPEPSKSAVDLPKYMIQNSDRFSYLLPGGCKRSH